MACVVRVAPGAFAGGVYYFCSAYCFRSASLGRAATRAASPVFLHRVPGRGECLYQSSLSILMIIIGLILLLLMVFVSVLTKDIIYSCLFFPFIVVKNKIYHFNHF